MQIGYKFNVKGKIYFERCTCYTSQIANLLGLDNPIPMIFNLKSLQKIF